MLCFKLKQQSEWQPQSPLYVPGTDPSITDMAFTYFMGELITSYMHSRLVCRRILVPLTSFSSTLELHNTAIC